MPQDGDPANLVELSTSDAAIRLLHQQIELLASRASTAYTVQAPLRVEQDSSGFPRCIWYESR